MKRKITIIFVTFFIAQIIIACCDCPDTYKYQYKIEYVTAYNLDNSGEYAIISESPIPKNNYGIRLQLGLRQLSLQNKNHFSLFNQAYAMCCVCGPDTNITPRDTITSLKVTTTAGIDSSHPEGSDVTDLFKMLKYGMYESIDSTITEPITYYKRKVTTTAGIDSSHPEGSDVTDLFKMLKYGMYESIDSTITEPITYYKRTDTAFLEMYLLSPPGQPGEYRFHIDISLSNKTHILADTKPIKLE